MDPARRPDAPEGHAAPPPAPQEPPPSAPPLPVPPGPPPEPPAGPPPAGYVFGRSSLFELPRVQAFCRARLEEEFGAGPHPVKDELLRRLGEAVHTMRAGFPLRPGGISVHEADRRVCAIADRYSGHRDYASLWPPSVPPPAAP